MQSDMDFVNKRAEMMAFFMQELGQKKLLRDFTIILINCACVSQKRIQTSESTH